MLTRTITGFCALLLAVATASPGCASRGYQRADRASDTIAQSISAADRGIAQTDDAMASLDRIMAGGPNVRNDYESFVAAAKGVESTSVAVKRHGSAMKSHMENHLEKWARESRSITDDSLRAAADERRAAARQEFDRATEAIQRADAAFPPMITALRDLQTYFGTDLTPHAVAGAKPMASRAHSLASTLKSELNALKEAMARVREHLPAAPPAPASPAAEESSPQK